MMLKKSVLMSVVVAAASAVASPAYSEIPHHPTVLVKAFTPKPGDHVGAGGFGWFIDLAIDYGTNLAATGFTGTQLTGPGAHNNVAPMPGTFSTGTDDHLPGLIVLVSTTTVGAKSCQNLANLFNLTGLTDVSANATEIWDTWIVGAPNFGVDTASTAYVAVAADRNGDGIYNDAPSVIPDADGNGICDEADLRAFGVDSNVQKVNFYINP